MNGILKLIYRSQALDILEKTTIMFVKTDRYHQIEKTDWFLALRLYP